MVGQNHADSDWASPAEITAGVLPNSIAEVFTDDHLWPLLVGVVCCLSHGDVAFEFELR